MPTVSSLEKSLSMHDKSQLQVIGSEPRLPVFVIFTTMNQTMTALEKAIQLAKPLKTGIEILDVQTVPYALSLNDPSVPSAFGARCLREMTARYSESIGVSAYRCRDSLEALKRIINRNCPVVLAIRKRWWPTRDGRLSRELRRAGYNLVLVKPSQPRSHFFLRR